MRRKLAAKHRTAVKARAEAPQSETEEERRARFKQTFNVTRNVDGVTGVAASLPTPVFYAASAAAAAGAAFAGYTAAAQAPVSGDAGKAASAGAAAVAGGAMAFGASKVSSKRGQAAGIDVWNSLAEAEDATVLDPEVGGSIKSKYGHSGEVVDSIKQAYSAYLTSMVPPGNVPLRGDEHLKLRDFLTAVGLNDEEAAPVHIDVGRTFFRARLEAPRGEEQTEGLRRFQKLVYVSSQLFGEVRSGFLTPWVARFNVTPEQVAIAKRDGALTIMSGRISSELGGRIPADAEALRMLREVQGNLGLSESACAKLVQDSLQADMTTRLKSAVELMKTRGSSVDYSPAVKALDDLLAESRAFASIMATETDPENPTVVAGIDALKFTIAPGGGVTRNDLVDLWKLYLEQKMEAAGTALSSDLERDLDDLTTMLSLPEGRVDDVRSSVVTGAYQKLLREAVVSGRMDESDSPAQVLNELIGRVSMPGELAVNLHDSMYRQKLRECLEDEKVDDADSAALERTARLLCLKPEAVQAADREMKGDILRKLLSVLVSSVSVDQFSPDEVEKVAEMKSALRLSDEDAYSVLKELGRAELVKRINTSRNKGQKLDIAKELKQTVFFSNVVLAPLVAATKGKSAEEKQQEAMKEIAETMAKAKAEADKEDKAEGAEEGERPAEAGEKKAEEATTTAAADADKEGEKGPVETAKEAAADGAEAVAKTAQEGAEKVGEAAEDVKQDLETKLEGEAVPASLAKAEKAKKEQEGADGSVTAEDGSEVKMSSQKDITVADDFELADRVEIYKTYLQYCMTGEVIQLPMGGTIVLERDEQEFARLSQLGDILGLTPMDTYQVHNSMAEEAFKAQAEAAAPGGDLSPEAAEKLNEMAEKMGIGEEKAQKIIRGVTNKKLKGTLQSMKAQGELTLEKVLQFKEQDIDVKSVLGDSMRMQLYEKHINTVLGSGEGAVDAERLLKGLPEDLALDPTEAEKKAQTAAKYKTRSIMVQAMSYYRQKNFDSSLKYLNNLMACLRVAQGDVGDANNWNSKEELLDVYGLYCSNVSEGERRDEMAAALKLESGDAEAVRDAVDSGTFRKDVMTASNKSASESIF